jgi:hypothetical protein
MSVMALRPAEKQSSPEGRDVPDRKLDTHLPHMMREVVFCPLTLRKSVDPHTSIEISAAGRLASGRLGRRRRMRVVAKREGSPIVGEPDELPFLGSLPGAGSIYWWALLPDKGYPDDGHETERQYDPVEPERSAAAQRTTNISIHRFTQLTCLSSTLETNDDLPSPRREEASR